MSEPYQSWLFALAGLLLVLWLISLNVRYWREDRDGNWHIAGLHRRIRGQGMRRLVNGRWEYRKMTEQELNEQYYSDMW